MIKKEGWLKWELKEVWALPEVNFFLTSFNSHFTTPSFLKQNKTCQDSTQLFYLYYLTYS